jgi:hypothetical protein
MNFNQSAIQYILCDYSELCGKSRVYNLKAKDDFVSDKNNSNFSSFVISNTSQDNDLTNNPPLYVNQEYNFQLTLPSFPTLVYTSSIHDKLTFLATDNIEATLIPVDGITGKSLFPKFQTAIEVDDSKYSSSLSAKFDYFKKLISAPLELNSSLNSINGYPEFEINHFDIDIGIIMHLVSVEMNEKVYTFFSIMDLKDIQYLEGLRQSIETLMPNQFKNMDIHTTNLKFVNELDAINETETLRQDYIFAHLTTNEYYNEALNFTMSYPSFDGNSPISIDERALETYDNDIYFELPSGHVTNPSPPTIQIRKTDPDVFEWVKKFVLGVNKTTPRADQDKLNMYWLDRFGTMTPNRHDIYKHLFKFEVNDQNMTGLVSKYNYFGGPENIQTKAVSFITKNNDHIVFKLTARLGVFAEYEPLFDAMVWSVKFH